LYVPVIASIFAICVVKEFFGGLGTNFINPALAGRAFVMFASITVMSDKMSYIITDTVSSSTLVDATTSATPMGILHYFNKGTIGGEQLSDLWKLFIGMSPGSIGEVSEMLLLLGALFLLYKRYIQWRIPLFYLLTVCICAFLYASFGGIGLIKSSYSTTENAFIYVLYNLVSGGLILGAFYMATDMVTSPITKLGTVIFAIGCGLITFIIRAFGQYPEGVMFSILIMNVATPLIDRFIRPRIYGTERSKA